MSDNNSLIPFHAGGITIQTVDGQTMNFTPAGWNNMGDPNAVSVAAFLGGPSGKPLPRLTVAQPKDDRIEDAETRKEWAGQFMLIFSEMVVNEKGENERQKTYVGPLGESVTGRVVGYKLNRSYLGQYNSKNANNEPLCRSENFIEPDARFKGKFSHICAQLNTKTARLDGVCPMARWGRKDPTTGKSAAPECNENYVVCLALKWSDLPDLGIEPDGEWLYVEAYFKSASANAGKTLIQHLYTIEYAKRAVYSFPLALTVMDAGIGYTHTGRLLIPQRGHEEEAAPPADEIEGLEAGVQLWQDALRASAERAARMDDEEPEDEQGSAAEAMGESAQTAAPAPAASTKKSNGSGKKAMI